MSDKKTTLCNEPCPPKDCDCGYYDNGETLPNPVIGGGGGTSKP